MVTTQLSNKAPEENENPGQDEFDKVIGHSYTPDEEKSTEERAERQNASDKDASADELSKLGQADSENGGFTKTGGDENKKSLYTPGAKTSGFSTKLNSSNNFKRYLILGGFGAALISMLILFFSFLSAFKLDGLMSAVEQRSFLRTNATLDTRSSKLMSAYIETRLLDMGDNPKFDNSDFKKNDNLLFRASRVDNNSPFTDWYKTLRASKFEQQVFEAHGIKFTSMVTADGKFRTGQIDINGEKPIPFTVNDISAADYANLEKGDIATINKLGDVVDSKVFNNNKEARRAIKDVVNNNTRFYEVYKRRTLRKAIQNMTGVKDWRFFETTRDNVSEKRIDLRDRMLDRMLPDPNNSVVADVVRCFYGLNKCSPNRDVAAPQNEVGGTGGDEGVNNEPNNTNDQTANEKKLKQEVTALDAAGISDALKKILVAANIYTKIINIPSTLDMLSYVNQNIPNLVKLIVVARGAQAAGLFQVFETSSDQIKSGQVSSAEVNAFMENIDTAANSDGYAKVVDGSGDPSVTQSSGVCSQQAQALQEKDPTRFKTEYKNDHPEYAPLCADQQIGSAANAQKIQDAYKSSLGPMLGPVAKAWGSIKGKPVLGQIIGGAEWLGNLTNGLVNTVVGGVLSALGLKDNVQGAVGWIFAKTSNFLGVSILKGYESGGTVFNWLIQGGAYSAESASRQEGAALTNGNSKVAVQNAIGIYTQDRKVDSSLYDRVASLDNPESLAHRGAFAMSNLSSDSIFSSLRTMQTSLGKNFGMLLGRNAYAATPNGYSASQFAGIETYDYPQKCYDMNPVTSQPIDGTNAFDIFRQYNISVSQDNLNALNSWDTESDSAAFYKTIYSIIGENRPNGDDIAVQIYNCNLLDSTVRGSIGYVFGYTDNNGLND